MSLFDSELANTQISSLSQLPTESSPLDLHNMNKNLLEIEQAINSFVLSPLSTLFMAFFNFTRQKKALKILKDDKQ